MWQGQPSNLWALLVGLVLAAVVVYTWRGRGLETLRLVRLLLLIWVGGLVGYLVYGFLWPPVGPWWNWSGGTVLAFAGAMLFTLLDFAKP